MAGEPHFLVFLDTADSGAIDTIWQNLIRFGKSDTFWQNPHTIWQNLIQFGKSR